MIHKVLVECSFQIEVEVDDKYSSVEFQIEDNGCPGTGVVNSKLMAHMADCEKRSICWSCALGGESKVIKIDGKPVENWEPAT